MKERLIAHLASVDIRHELGFPLAGVCALSQEDNPRLIHVRHGLALKQKRRAKGATSVT